jgi:Tfp pilus assembly protein PilO
MMRYLDKLNLRPNERRLVVVVALVFFVVLNLLFIVPHFSDWKREKARMIAGEKTLAMFRAELKHKPEYERKVKELESDGGTVLPEDQAIDFDRFIERQVGASGVLPTQKSRVTTRNTNDFFSEREMSITVESREKQLVNFLQSLGAGNSIMRIRSLSLRPLEPAHQQLRGNVTIVASYQKALPTRSATPPAKSAPTTPETAKPAVATAPSPAPKPDVKTAVPTNKTSVVISNRMAALTNRLSPAIARTASTNKPGTSTVKKP